MDKLIVLGTGNAQAIHCYNTCFALREGEEYFLVDAGGGNGILTALDKKNIALEQIHHIFVTHAHNDHILGMVWMVRMIATSMNKGKYEGNLTIYCHKELEDTIKTLVKLTVGKKFYKHFDERILFNIVGDGDNREIMGNAFTFFDIQSTKEKQFGCRIETKEGVKIAFMGDEPYRPAMKSYTEGADWMFHEAFCLYDQRDIFKPYEKHHSTVKDACELAKEQEIPNMILWHTEDKCIDERKEKYMAEGTTVYDGNLYVPDDLEEIMLTK